MIHTEDNKRLAKNTLVLYFRTIIITIVSLFTSRVLLQNLGVQDYGVYNVVGSIVVLFSFFNSALTTSTQRFLTVSLGRNDKKEMRSVFSTSMSIQIILIFIVGLLAEILGPWFINNRLNIPLERVPAANWAFHLSILTFALNILRIPYNASIIAYERMDLFAYLSIFDTFLKLAIAYAICFAIIDSLVFYAILLAIESVFLLLLHYIICNKEFGTCRYERTFEKSIFKRMFVFAGWSTFGSFSNIATQNGFIYILNIFCGVVANAAMGIANQVVGALNAFVSSFQTSFYPQIVKAYAQGDNMHLNSLISRTSKFSFELMIIPALILFVNIKLILRIWLAEVPEYADIFCQMILVCATIDALTGPYYCGIMATGKIRKYQIAISLSFLSDIIFVYLLLKGGISPRYILLSRIVTRGIINMLIGLRLLKIQLKFDVYSYLRNTIRPISLQLLGIIPVLVFLSRVADGWSLLLASILIIGIFFIITTYFIVFNKTEQQFVYNIFATKMSRKS